MLTCMSLVGLELDNGSVLIKFLTTTAESNGELHAQEARYAPRSPWPPMHCHPKQEERFQVHQGTLTFRLGTEERTLEAGEELAIPRGVHHQARNAGAEPALVLWETRPALRSAELYRALFRKGPRPGLLEGAALMNEFRDEFRLAKPPPLVQAIVFGCLGPVGKALGYLR
jgi:mannose-6-phosphate isomerase-like protein (cupin superfamily)